MMPTGENRSTLRKICPGATSSTTLLTWGPTRASQPPTTSRGHGKDKSSVPDLRYVRTFRSHRTHLTLCFG